MKLLVRALTVAALASLVFAGIALAAAHDASAAPYDQQPVCVHLIAVDAPPEPPCGPDDVYVWVPLDRMLQGAILRRATTWARSNPGQLPPEYFRPEAQPEVDIQPVANMTGSPVDVIVY